MPTSPSTAAVPPKRRWLRFSLRGVLVLIAVIAVLLWIPIQRAKNQKHAVEKVRELGGVVEYDFAKFAAPQPLAPPWLRRLLGDDFFCSVYQVSFTNLAITDADVESLRDLPDLERVSLRGCKNLTDAALAPCGTLAKLYELNLADTNLGDGTLAPLRNHPLLAQLWLDNTKLTDAGLADAGTLRNLRTLRLAGTQITDAGLPKLSPLKNLGILSLHNTQITDRGLSALATLPIYHLQLSDTPHISDAALAELRNFPKLAILDVGDYQKTRRSPISTSGVSQLDSMKGLVHIGLAGADVDDSVVPHLLKHALQNVELSGTKLTDAGLAQLTSLPGIRSLLIDNTAVTDAGLANLKSFQMLTHLGLEGTQISDAGLANVQPLTTLVVLNLANTQIADAGLPKLAGLTKLLDLKLGKTNVTDAGILSLAPIANLRLLRLGGTQVTDAGIAQLRQQLPQLRVER